MKIIASDFDGTVNYHGISQADREAIKRFRSKGNKFGIVTGRDLEMSNWVLHDFKKAETEIDFLISCTGAVIRDGNGEVLMVKRAPVTPEFLDIVEKARELGFGSFNFNDGMHKLFIDPNGKIETDISLIPSFTQLNVWFDGDEKAEQFNKFVNENYSHLISAYRNGGSVDMPPPNTSKVTGVYDYAAQFDNPEIYSVGDNLNDLPMIKEFCGFAVSNAHSDVKAAAKHQCDRICDMIDYIMENE